ncbi:MAG: hypothetical protein WCH35_15345 [Comamonadaceae bacterium]
MILQLATEDNVTLPSYEVTGENFASNGENAQEFIQPQNQFNDNETAIRAAALASRTNAANGCFSLCSMAGMGTQLTVNRKFRPSAMCLFKTVALDARRVHKRT